MCVWGGGGGGGGGAVGCVCVWGGGAELHDCGISWAYSLSFLYCQYMSPLPGVFGSSRPFVRPSVRLSVNIYPGYLVSATPLTVLYKSF